MFILSSKSKIIVPKGGNSHDGYAEKQLKKYLEQITQEQFEIVDESNENYIHCIYVGETKHTRSVFGNRFLCLKEDGYAIYSDGRDLYLTGKDSVYTQAGTIYAVFEFLQFLGVKFYSFDEEYVPLKQNIEIAEMDILKNPNIFMRQYLAASTRRHTDYCVKMRIKDSYCGDVPGGTLNPLWADGQGHNYFEYCDPKKYQEEHSEWFDMDNHQLCFSQTESAKVIAEGLKKKILAKPLGKFFAFGQNDTPTPCQCEKCKQSYEKYGVSGTMIRYSNLVAEEIKTWSKEVCPEREIYIVVMAYLFSVTPPVQKTENGYQPVDPSVIPCDNMYIYYCNIDYCFYHALTDESCEWNKKFKDEFFGWQSLVGDKMLIWNYSANYSHYLYPFYGYNVIAQNYRFFVENHVKHVLEHGACEAEYIDFAELKTYVYSKLLWDPQLDTDVLMNEFIEVYYKQCASDIKNYFALIKERLAAIDQERGYHLRVYHLPEDMFAVENFPLEFINELFGCFENALKKIGEKEDELRKRVIRGYISAKYLLLMNYDKYGLTEKEAFLSKFLEDCQYCGIKKYKEDWRQNIDMIPNLIEEARREEVLKY